MREKTVIFLLVAGILLFGGMYVRRAEEEQAVYTAGSNKELPVVVLDAGHGGKDPRQG